jgi:hypothetical protein
LACDARRVVDPKVILLLRKMPTADRLPRMDNQKIKQGKGRPKIDNPIIPKTIGLTAEEWQRVDLLRGSISRGKFLFSQIRN